MLCRRRLVWILIAVLAVAAFPPVPASADPGTPPPLPPGAAPPVAPVPFLPEKDELLLQLQGGDYAVYTATCWIDTQWAHQSGPEVAVHATTNCNAYMTELGIDVALWRYDYGSSSWVKVGGSTPVVFGRRYLDARASTPCPGGGYWYTGTAYHWAWWYRTYGHGYTWSTANVWIDC